MRSRIAINIYWRDPLHSVGFYTIFRVFHNANSWSGNISKKEKEYSQCKIERNKIWTCYYLPVSLLQLSLIHKMLCMIRQRYAVFCVSLGCNLTTGRKNINSSRRFQATVIWWLCRLLHKHSISWVKKEETAHKSSKHLWKLLRIYQHCVISQKNFRWTYIPTNKVLYPRRISAVRI
jgi:hypothetical protein